MKASKIGLILFVTACLLSCNMSKEKESLNDEKKALYLEKGNLISKLTFGVLSQKLKSSLAEEGVSGAVKYCSVKAYPIVDSLSGVYNAKIRRTSLNVRNKENNPTELEKDILSKFDLQYKDGKELSEYVQKLEDGSVAFYKPIYINTALCLTCHGKLSETVIEDNYKIIKQLYPDDEAVGYENGDLRGMWSIVFEEL